MRIDIKKYHEFTEKENLTDTEVRTRANIDEGDFKRIMENGFSVLETLEKIAGVLHVDVEEIATEDPNLNGENMIEFFRNAPEAVVTFTQTRYVIKIKKLAEERPDECKIIAENDDGTICARIPTKWIKISPSRIMSEEELERRREQIKKNFGRED